jgi:hypothetical protein
MKTINLAAFPSASPFADSPFRFFSLLRLFFFDFFSSAVLVVVSPLVSETALVGVG